MVSEAAYAGPGFGLADGRRAGGEKAARYAYAFLLYGPSCEQYFLGIVAATWMLIKNLCIHRRVLLHTPDVPRAVLDLAHVLGIFSEVVQTDYIEASEVFFSNPQAHRRFGRIFTKYQVLGLAQYKKVLLLDADLHVRSNLDGLFELEPPAAMARGPAKPPAGARMPGGTPVNAGVMLLRPDQALLRTLLGEVTGPKPRRLPHFNSPDSDYLTEHPELRGTWTSLPLECNFQLEFERLDPRQGTVRFSSAREAHFSEEGASLPWDVLRVLHFSGAKPWELLLEDASALQRLRVDAGSGRLHAALGQKLVDGIGEYAREVASLQGMLSQLQVGEGVLWRSARWKEATLGVPLDLARERLQEALPPCGRWFQGPRPGCAVWIPPGEGALLGAPVERAAPVAAYLEVAAAAPAFAPGDTVQAAVDGRTREFQLVSLGAAGTASVRRRVVLPPDWQVVPDAASGCDYYHNTLSNTTTWEFPDLPHDWQAVATSQTTHTYYHNMRTDQTRWDPPEVEELDLPVDALTLVQPLQSKAHGTLVTIWRRSFILDHSPLHWMSESLARVQQNGS